MADHPNGVHYKATLVRYDVNVSPEVRRFCIDRDVSTNLGKWRHLETFVPKPSSFTSLYTLFAAYLQGKLVSLFPPLRREQYTVTWTDNDDDTVTIGSDEELVIALTDMKGPVYKVTVIVKDKKRQEKESMENSKGEVHEGIKCDSCDEDVCGFRYKCVVCPDYDLCGMCESKGMHPGHNMIRISSPAAAFPGHFFRRINKMHERMHKRATEHAKMTHDIHAAAASAATSAAVGGMGFEEFEGFRPPPMGRPRCGFGPGRGGRGRCGGRGGRMWDEMVRGWMGEEKPKEDAAEANKKDDAKAPRTAENQSNEKTEQASARGKSPLEEILNQFAQGGAGAEYLRNVGNMVVAALDPLGVDVQVDIEHGGKRTNVSVPKNDTDEDKSDERGKETNGTIPKKSTEEHSDEDDWTVVKDGDDEAATEEPEVVVNIPIQVQDKEEEQVTEIPIQVEKKPSENKNKDGEANEKPPGVLYAAPDGTLYPDLTKEDSSKKDEEEEVKPSAPVANVAVHPNPKIQVALQAMMNMGFSNEGNWLAQLLEAKDGDIGKVLDILQPVRPVRM